MTDDDVARICSGRHGDPFAVLGPHVPAPGQLLLRAFLPGAREVWAIAAGSRRRLAKLHPLPGDGLFERRLASGAGLRYRYHIRWLDGSDSIEEDPYRFGLLLSDLDIWLLSEGTHLRPYEVLGAHSCQIQDVAGTRFAVWAPHASRVAVVGDFNFWDGRRHPMRRRREWGVWELFLPGVQEGARYKFEIRDAAGQLLPLRADPYARQAELRPATASIVAPLLPRLAGDERWRLASRMDAPVSIYEVHPGSWRRKPGQGHDGDAAPSQWLSWDELGDALIPYACDLGFTHLELMPVSEHPFDGSWGYQPLGLYAPTARFGTPEAFARFVARCHEAGLGVLLDWVPAHFPDDAHGLGRFDGTALYEYADPREGFHKDWNTLIYNFSRHEVRNFLIGNGLYWMERFGVDGLRVDAVSSMLYRDYSRKPGEWLPNHLGGRENLEAISLLRRMNEIIGAQRPQAITVAEESTAFAAVSRPTDAGGLGFHYKWNMGWMHDTLGYMGRDPVHRKHHHGEMSFAMVYAYSEHFILPISHDEVVHGKGSLLSRMPGDRWQKFANLRAFLGFMFAHPGKKLLFMGCEFGQWREWQHEHSLDWHLLREPDHQGIQHLVRDLNRIYRDTPALYQRDHEPAGFEWIDAQDAQRSLFSFLRSDQQGRCWIIVSNFTPTLHRGYRLGVPHPGLYRERLNTDAQCYGGTNSGTPFGQAQSEPIGQHGRADSVLIDVPPLSTVMFEWIA